MLLDSVPVSGESVAAALNLAPECDGTETKD
jgi:hypothetical protein